MSLRSILFGQECRDCEALGLGVRCKQVTDEGPISFIWRRVSTVYVDNETDLRTLEPIDQCPAVIGKSTNLQVADKLRKTAKRIEGAERELWRAKTACMKSRLP